MDPEISDQDLLSQALTDTPPVDPPAEPPAEPTPAEPAEPPADDRPRDDKGRFAPKTGDEPPPAPPPAAVTAPEPPQHQVPVGALQEERKKRQEIEQQLVALRAQFEYAERVRTSQQQPPVVPQGQLPPAPPPNVFEDPDAFVDHRVQPLVTEFRSIIQAQNDRWEALSRSMAYSAHGKETVDAAQNAMATALRSGDPTARMEYQRITGSVDPYAELMEWNKRTTVLQQVGTDPQAWLAKQLDEKLNDPAFLQKALDNARAKASGQTPAQSGARPPTAVSLPPSLRTIPSASGPATDDVDPNDDAALLSNALARPKRR